MGTQNIILIILGIIIFIFIYNVWSNDNDIEKYKAYHFGFPTHGSYNSQYINNPFMYNWGGNPYNYGWRSAYYQDKIYPYLSDTGKPCYSVSQGDSCSTEYTKISIDTNDDGTDDTWKCCRYSYLGYI